MRADQVTRDNVGDVLFSVTIRTATASPAADSAFPVASWPDVAESERKQPVFVAAPLMV
jgi:hypothetical protein